MFRLFRIFIPISTFTLLVTEILVTNASFLAASYALSQVDPTDYLFYDGGIIGILGVSGIFILCLYFSGLYSDVFVSSKIVMLYQLFLITGVTFLFEGLISSVASQLRLPIRVMLAGSCVSIAAIYSWRILFSRYANHILGNAQVLLVGTEPVVGALGRYIDSHPQKGMRIAGCVLEKGPVEESMLSGPTLGYTGQLSDIVETVRPSRVVVGTSLAATPAFARVLENLRYSGHTIQDAMDTYETVCGRIWIRGVAPAELIYASRLAPPARHILVQRVVGALIASIGLLILSPVLALIWIWLRASSSGPVLVSEPRVGLNNRIYAQYQFQVDPKNHQEPSRKALSATFGSFPWQRMPELINVVKGDMALAGPKAERPEFLEVLSRVIPYYPQRSCVRPGITGWAQIHSWADCRDTHARLEYDFYYIKNMSMSLDLVILFQALRTVF